MRGLDPRIHLLEEEALDCRVKPGNDALKLFRSKCEMLY